MKKIVYYVNQFYGQIGGEEAADQTPIVKEGSVGPAVAMQEALKDIGEVVATIVCGDNYFADHQDEALEEILKVVEEKTPDLFIAGPGFNAGRYGLFVMQWLQNIKFRYLPVFIRKTREQKCSIRQYI